MENLAIDHHSIPADEDFAGDYPDSEVVEFEHDYLERDSLSENFINELESWARHALAANGFADF